MPYRYILSKFSLFCSVTFPPLFSTTDFQQWIFEFSKFTLEHTSLFSRACVGTCHVLLPYYFWQANAIKKAKIEGCAPRIVCHRMRRSEEASRIRSHFCFVILSNCVYMCRVRLCASIRVSYSA